MAAQKISHREFVVTWTRSQSLEDVVKSTGLSKPGVISRAKMLRKLGVKLKKFTGQRKRLTDLDIAQLNDLIRKTEKG